MIRHILKRLPSWFWWALGLASFMQVVEFHGWLAGPEGKLVDFFLTEKRYVPFVSIPPPPKLVLLEIDDSSYQKCFDRRSPMLAASVYELLTVALRDSVPIATGVDILTDSPEYADPTWGNRQFNIIWAAGAESSGETRQDETFLEWFVGPQPIAVKPGKVLGREPEQKGDWGIPIYPTDEDLHLRRFPRTILTAVKPDAGWIKRIADKYCTRKPCPGRNDKADELILYDAVRDLERYSVDTLFDCTSLHWNEKESPSLRSFRESEKEAILLIGGTFASSRDFYRGPSGSISGLELNADAITAEIMGTGVSEVPPWFRLALDFCTGCFIGWIFETDRIVSRSVNRRLTILIGVVCLIVFASAELFYAGYVWLSYIGVLVGMILHVLIVIWEHDFQLKPESSTAHSITIREERVTKLSVERKDPD